MRYAVCNELFGETPLSQACALTAEYGFQGIEIAPFTLSPDPTALRPAQVASVRRAIEGAGLSCAGLHWLLAAPAELHITTADAALRRRSWAALERLAAVCADLGGQVMVLGSPKQRSAVDMPVAAARENLVSGLRTLAPVLERLSVALLVEPLSTDQTNLITSMTQAREVIEEVSSPAVGGMFDFHNSRDEGLSAAELIRAHAGLIRHVHLNTLDGSYPRGAEPQAKDAFSALRETGFSGWVSLEIFHFDHPPAQVLETTRRTLNALAGGV